MALLAININKVPDQVAFIKKNSNQNTLIIQVGISIFLILNSMFVFFSMIPSAICNFTIATNVSTDHPISNLTLYSITD